MPHNFWVSNLKESNQIKLFSKLKPAEMESRLTVFVMHHDWLDLDWKSIEFYNEIHQFLHDHTQKSYVPNMSITDGIYIRFNPTSPDTLTQFCQEVCLWQNEKYQIFLFINGITYRTLLKTGMHSEIVLDSRRYLIWNYGPFWPDNDNDHIKKAWEGSTWCKCSLNQTLIESFFNDINDKAKTLNERRRMRLKNSPLSNDELARSVAKRLCAYMPRYRNASSPYACYPLEFQDGNIRPLYGPMPWHGLVDKRLSTLEQDMILEGWLTVWENSLDATYTVQPASLLLLYWAARTLGILEEISVQGFIKNHCWEGWFGGRGVSSS